MFKYLLPIIEESRDRKMFAIAQELFSEKHSSSRDSSRNASVQSEERLRRKARRQRKESDCRQAQEDVRRRFKQLAAFIEANGIHLSFEELEEWMEAKPPDEFCRTMEKHIDNGLDQLPLNQRCGDRSYPDEWERLQRMEILRARISHFSESMKNASD